MKSSILIAFVVLGGVLDAQLFAPPEIYSATHVATPRAVVADFTGDGQVDIAIDATDAMTSAIDVYPMTSSGGVLGPVRTAWVNPAYAPSQEPTWLIGSGDLNQDGMVDLVTTSACPGFPGEMRLHLNVGGGHFATQPLSPGLVGSGMGSAVVSDLDGDGSSEIIAADGTPGVWSTRVYLVSGSPPLVTTIATLPAFGLLTVGDFNGDGLKDIAIAAPQIGGGHIKAFVQGAGLVFTAATPVPAPFSFSLVTCDPLPNYWLVANDLDFDGDDDVLLQMAGSFGIVFPGDPVSVLGSWVGPQPQYYGLSGFVEPIAGDFDSDGVGEIVLGSFMRRAPPAFLATPSWLNLPFIVDAFGGVINAVAAADVDGDGDRDLIYAGEGILAIARGETIRPGGCATGTSGVAFLVGSAYPGNAAYALRLAGLQPGAPAVLGVSTAPGLAAAGPCLAGISLDPAHLLLPMGPVGYATANAVGIASVPLPIPNDPALLGAEYYAQWIAADPVGPWVVGGVSYVLSVSRKIVIW